MSTETHESKSEDRQSADCAYFEDADWRLETIDDEIKMGQHFELCVGGYDGDATVIGEIYDEEAVAHFVDIRMGVAGRPAKKIATYQPKRLSDALEAFFFLRSLDQPLYHIGGMMCLRIGCREELIEKMAELCDLEEDEVEDLTYRCQGPCEDVMDVKCFRTMSALLGPFSGGDPI